MYIAIGIRAIVHYGDGNSLNKRLSESPGRFFEESAQFKKRKKRFTK